MKERVVVHGGGAGSVGLLQVALIVLKLLDKIDWSWWWVLSPTWGVIALCVALVAFYIMFLVVVEAIHDVRRFAFAHSKNKQRKIR